MRRSRSQLAPIQDRDAQIPTRIEFRLKEGPGVPPSSAKYKLIARVVRIVSPFLQIISNTFLCLECSKPKVAYSSIGFDH